MIAVIRQFTPRSFASGLLSMWRAFIRVVAARSAVVLQVLMDPSHDAQQTVQLSARASCGIQIIGCPQPSKLGLVVAGLVREDDRRWFGCGVFAGSQQLDRVGILL